MRSNRKKAPGKTQGDPKAKYRFHYFILLTPLKQSRYDALSNRFNGFTFVGYTTFFPMSTLELSTAFDCSNDEAKHERFRLIN